MVLVGPVIFWVALVVAAAADAGSDRDDGVVAALVTGAVAIPAILLLARRRGRWEALALRRPGTALVGVVAVLGPAALVVGVDAWAGGVRVLAVDVPTLLLFVLGSTVLAVLQEALPEELAFRGLAHGELVRRVAALPALGVTTALFALGVPAAIAVSTMVTGEPLRVAPVGQDPVEYVVLLTVFAVVLSLLRIVTGSLWAPIAAHLTFLGVNRVLVGAGDTGVEVVLPPDGELLVLVYLLLSIGVLLAVLLVRRWRRATTAGGAGCAG